MTMSRHARPLAVALSLFLAAGAAAAPEPVVLREGAGERRAALDKMERKPLDPAVWSAMVEGLDGKVVTSADAAGRVVVLYTWSSFLSGADRPIAALNRIVEKYGDDVLVIGVHHPEGWEDAKAAAERRRAAFPIVRDSGKLREALMVDQDPDLYVVDRAGQLRYADVDIASLDAAVATLVAETTEVAAKLNDRLALSAAQQAEQERRTRLLRQQMELGKLPEVSFDEPSAVEYESAKWPTMWQFQGQNSSGERKKDKPRPVDLESLSWDSPGTVNFDGRVRLLYFFSVERRTGSGDAAFVYDEFQNYQRAHARDLVVACGIMPLSRQNNNNNDDPEAETRRITRLHEQYQEFIKRRPLNHPTVDLIENSEFVNAVTGAENNQSEGIPVPYVALVSSDGQLRWHGVYYRDREDFRAALEKMLEVDPGVKARRAAEDAYIRRAVDERVTTAAPAAPEARADRATPPTAAAYASASWPKPNTEELGARMNLQGKELPMTMGGEEWLTREITTHGKVVVIDFWATWCPPCRRSSPIFDRLQKANPDALAVLAISGSGEDRATVTKYIAEHKTSYHHLFDGEQRLAKAIGVEGIPHTLVLSSDGVVRWQGNPLTDGFEKAVKQVIASDPMAGK